MRNSTSPRPTTRQLRRRRALLLTPLLIGAVAAYAPRSTTSGAADARALLEAPLGPARSVVRSVAGAGPQSPSAGGVLGIADGAVPDGTTIFDDAVPGVANLRPALLGALRRAASDAAPNGLTFTVNSGWRSAAYEDGLRRDAVATYGSEAAAARWVATGTTSPHVSGDAVDLGPASTDRWLAAHGAAYGLCQIYANEPWHFELRTSATRTGCPAMYADPTHDPRMGS